MSQPNPLSRSSRSRRLPLLAFVACTLIIPARLAGETAAAAPAPARRLTVAIVRDGASWLWQDLDRQFRAEARELAAGRAELVFKEAPEFDAGWQPGGAARALDAALADAEADLVVAFGPASALAAAAPDRPLPKPVLGAVVAETDLVHLPIGADGRATKPNFAVVAASSRARDQLAELRAAVPFDSLHVLLDPATAPAPAMVEAWRDGLARALAVPVTVVPLGESADAALAAIGPEARTIFLFPAVRMDGPNRAALVQGLSARKFPVLAFLGQPEVEAGALAGVLPHQAAALARRLAINLDQLVAGAAPARLPLSVAPPRQLFFNQATAAAIGFAPDFQAVARATAVAADPAEPAAGRAISLTGAMTLALERNFDVRSRQSATQASAEGTRAAAGTLRPQLAATGSFQQIDRDRAEASGGAQPRWSQRAGLSLTQVIVDDEAVTRLRVARESETAARRREQVEQLDAAQAAGQAYLSLLSAHAAHRVAEENFQVTQRNLELALLRQRVGTSGPEEAYRFESLAAQQRAELVFARTRVERAQVALSQVLGVELDAQWRVREAGLDDPAFAFTTGRVMALVRDRARLERFRSFVTAYAAEHSPDLKALEQDVRAQRLTAGQKARRSTRPKVALTADFARTLDQEYAGPSLADQLAGAGLPVSATAADRNNWTVGVTASLPLFTGGTVAAEARRSRAELRQLELTRDGAREAVMAQTQAALSAAEGAYANIALSRQAADLAARNLAVVQDKYERGAVSIVTLLDAQNSAFAQRQSAAVAVYDFLSALLELQRAMGWIEALATPAEKAAWVEGMERAVGP